MDPLEENRFGVDEIATVGDLAMTLYALGIDTPSDAQDALDTLAQYAIMPADADVNDPVTGVDVQDALQAFSDAVGVPFTKDPDAVDSPLSRGALAAIIMEYTLPLMG